MLNNLEKKLKYLNTYLDRENSMARIFRQPVLVMPLSQSDVDTLVSRIGAQLSPENLSCDGELPMSEIRARAKLYQGAYKDLTKYCAKNQLEFGALEY